MAALKALTLIPLVACLAYPVNGGATLTAGKLAALDAQGNLVVPTEATGLIVVGRVESKAGGIAAGQDVDNSAGADGDVSADVRPGVYFLDNSGGADEITQAEIGEVCYVIDGETVAKTDGGATRSVAGIVVALGDQENAGKIAVACGFSLFAQPAPAPGGTFLQSKSVTVPFNHASFLAEGDDGDAVDINVGTALPAGAVLLAARYTITIPFVGAGLASLTMMVGFAGDTNGVIEAVDILGDAAAEYRGVPGTAMGGPAGSKQLVANFDPDAAAGLDELTAGSVKIDVFYTVSA